MTQNANLVDAASPFFGKVIATLHVIQDQGASSVYLTQEGKNITNQLKGNNPYQYGQFALFLETDPSTDPSDETVEQEAIAFLRTSPQANLFIEKNPHLPAGEYPLVATHFFPPRTRPAETARISSLVSSRLKV